MLFDVSKPFVKIKAAQNTHRIFAFATLEMMSDAMNKEVPKFEDAYIIWKRKHVRKVLCSLD